MKNKLLTLVLAVFTIGCTSQPSPKLAEYAVYVPHWDDEYKIMEFQLNGKVKQVVHSIYSAKMRFGEVEAGTPRGKFVCNFDEEGKIVDFTVYDKQYDWNYDDYYLVMEQKVIFAYNENGDMTEKRIYDKDGEFIFKLVYTYTNGKRSLLSAYGRDGESGVKLTYKYDEKNRLIEEPLFEGMDYAFAKDLNLIPEDLCGVVKYAYDSSGELATLQIDYNSESEIDRNYICSLSDNDEGVVLKERWSSGMVSASYHYDTNKKLAREEYYDQNGILDGGMAVTYETMGEVQNVLNEKFFLTNTMGYHYTYEYDDSGNWIEASRSYGEHEPELLQLRTITYYDAE